MKRRFTDYPAVRDDCLYVVEWRGVFCAWYMGRCGDSSDCPLMAAARCLARAARNAGEFGWFKGEVAP